MTKLVLTAARCALSPLPLRRSAQRVPRAGDRRGRHRARRSASATPARPRWPQLQGQVNALQDPPDSARTPLQTEAQRAPDRGQRAQRQGSPMPRSGSASRRSSRSRAMPQQAAGSARSRTFQRNQRLCARSRSTPSSARLLQPVDDQPRRQLAARQRRDAALRRPALDITNDVLAALNASADRRSPRPLRRRPQPTRRAGERRPLQAPPSARWISGG